MNKIKNSLSNLRTFRWGLWASLCALALVPAIYQTIRTALVSTNVSASGIDVLGQMEWFDLIDETIRAFLVVPLYSVLNKIFKETKEKFAAAVFKTGIVVFILYLVFSLIVFFYGIYLISFMNSSQVDVNEVNRYLQLETVAFVIGIIPSFINVVFVTVGKSKNVYIFMVIHIILGAISDFVLVPQMGVNGIAVSNIISNAVMTIAGIVILLLEGYLKPCRFMKNDKLTAIEWLKVGSLSGVQQFIDNIVYALMIGRMVNLVAEQGNYWVANNFIWGWMLIPVAALGEVIKSDCKEGYSKLTQSNYYLLITFITIFWALTIPGWSPFFQYAERLENYQEIFTIVLKLSPFYIAYALCIPPDSIFIGTGKTMLNALNSVIVNFVYYGVWFVLYLTKAISFGMDTIILMFGCGMVFHLGISWLEEYYFIKRKIPNNKEEKTI